MSANRSVCRRHTCQDCGIVVVEQSTFVIVTGDHDERNQDKSALQRTTEEDSAKQRIITSNPNIASNVEKADQNKNSKGLVIHLLSASQTHSEDAELEGAVNTGGHGVREKKPIGVP